MLNAELGMALCTFNYPCHGSYCFNRVVTGGSFRREHYCVGTVQNRVGNVKHFRAGRCWCRDHRLHHLGRCDHHFVGIISCFNQLFLNSYQIGIANFHTQITAGYHNAVSAINNAGQELRGNGFGALDFGNNMSTAVFRLQQLAGLFDIFKGAYKGDGQVVGIKGGGSFDIRLVLVGQGRSRRDRHQTC